MRGRKVFALLLCAGEAVEAAGKVVLQDGISMANMLGGMRVVRERHQKNNIIDVRTVSVPGEKRKEIGAEKPRAVSLRVREARRAARGAGGAWEVRGGRRSKHLGEGISFCPRIVC